VTLQSKGNATDPEIAALAPWFHNLHLPGGVETAPDHPLGDFPAYKWRDLAPALPEDLAGWTALDIGCNAGFYSFELARRGAHVVGLDLDEHYLRQARWAAARLGLEDAVEFRRGSVYDLAGGQRYDLILFMGVLYHLRHPLLALDVVASIADRLVVLQTLSLPGEETLEAPPDLPLERRDELLRSGWPQMAFVERRLASDPTNWWVPNGACVEAMARSAGLDLVARPGHEMYVYRPSGLPATVAEELDAAVQRRMRTSTNASGNAAASTAAGASG
jgi:tRNA (mo5U34)-methyltransferase